MTRTTRREWLAGALAGAVAATTSARGEGQLNEVRLGALRRGVNLSHWFSQSADYSDRRLGSWIGESDLSLIATVGLKHVRLPVDPAFLRDPDDPEKFKADRREWLDRALRMIHDAGLAVVVDMHPEDEFKLDLRRDRDALARFEAFWSALAAHLKPTDPDRVFLEVLNEPVIDDARDWRTIQGRLLKAIRSEAPDHTLIACCDRWSAVDRLERLQPYDDPNLIYTFHCYDPHTFTHQGASWGDPRWKHLKGLPYPSAPERLRPGLGEIEDERARALAKDYGAERWGPERVDAQIGRAAQWAGKHKVAVYCGEFGVYRAAPAAARLAWLRDMARAVRKYKIGWAMWDYAGGFALAEGPPGRRRADPEVLRALGL